jgi:hypothetical protein
MLEETDELDRYMLKFEKLRTAALSPEATLQSVLASQ